MKKNLYESIEDDLKSRIQSGELSANSKLPSEDELSAAYCVSKATLRKAFSNLIDEGYLIVKPRVGYFVKEPNKTSYRMKFSIQQICKEPISGIKIIQAKEDREIINCKPVSIFTIQKVYEVMNMPIAIETLRILTANRVMEKPDRAADADFCEQLIEKTLKQANKRELNIQVVHAKADVCEILDCFTTDPFFKIGVSYYTGNSQLAVSEIYFLGEYAVLNAVV